MATNLVEIDALTRLGRAISDPTRARILWRLVESSAYPAQIATELNLTRSNVSNHLGHLFASRLVDRSSEGLRTRYWAKSWYLKTALRAIVAASVVADGGNPPGYPHAEGLTSPTPAIDDVDEH